MGQQGFKIKTRAVGADETSGPEAVWVMRGEQPAGVVYTLLSDHETPCVYN